MDEINGAINGLSSGTFMMDGFTPQTSSYQDLVLTVLELSKEVQQLKLGQQPDVAEQLNRAATPTAAVQQLDEVEAATNNTVTQTPGATPAQTQQVLKPLLLEVETTLATLEAALKKLATDFVQTLLDATLKMADALQNGIMNVTHMPGDPTTSLYILKRAQKAGAKAMKKAQESGASPTEIAEAGELATKEKAEGLAGAIKGGLIAGLVLSTASNLVSPFLKDKTEYAGDEGDLAETMDHAYDSISDAAASIPVWGTMISGIMKGGAMAGKVLNNLGVGTDGMTKTDAILSSSFLNLTPVGLINAAGAKKANKVDFGWLDTMKQAELLGGYGGSERLLADAKHKSGKKYGLFSSGARDEANLIIAKANLTSDTLNAIADANEVRLLAANGMTDINTQLYLNDTTGLRIDNVAVGKLGLKIDTPECSLEDLINDLLELRLEMLSELNYEVGEWTPEEEEVSAFKAGGSLNLIPEGALHARLNKMEGGGKDFTKKGIPVIDTDGKQLAEIECNEIIFRKEATDKLELLWKDGSDEAAIEAGKLLVDEIFNKTEDRTGLILTLTGESEKHLEDTKKPLPKKEFGGVLGLTQSEKDMLLLLLLEKANAHD